jgi:hypothetical protein
MHVRLFQEVGKCMFSLATKFVQIPFSCLVGQAAFFVYIQSSIGLVLPISKYPYLRPTDYRDVEVIFGFGGESGWGEWLFSVCRYAREQIL